MQFPTHSQNILKFIREIRFSLVQDTDDFAIDKFSALCRLFEEFQDFEYDVSDDYAIIHQDGFDIYFPLPLPRIKLEHIACGYAKWLFNKYSLDGFVQVEQGDTIIDCGAFVGGFSIACAKTAELLIAIEPSAKNYWSLERNLRGYDNVLVLRSALGDKPGISKLNCSTSDVEHSLMVPDDQSIEHQETVSVLTIEDLVKTIGISKIDFLKVEAEGYEPEIITGMEHISPRKIAVDVSPERGGDSPALEIRKDLESRNYECRQRGHVLFAKIIAA